MALSHYLDIPLSRLHHAQQHITFTAAKILHLSESNIVYFGQNNMNSCNFRTKIAFSMLTHHILLPELRRTHAEYAVEGMGETAGIFKPALCCHVFYFHLYVVE